MHTLRIQGYVNDSIVDGPGIRFTIFTQGCNHFCPGCHNPQTHSPDGGKDISIDRLLELIQENPLLDGITISGGEPFLQADACAELAAAVKKIGLSVWTYTGFLYEDLLEKNESAILRLLTATDILVDGPFIVGQRSLELQFRGSKNQRIINVTKSLEGKTIVLEN